MLARRFFLAAAVTAIGMGTIAEGEDTNVVPIPSVACNRTADLLEANCGIALSSKTKTTAEVFESVSRAFKLLDFPVRFIEPMPSARGLLVIEVLEETENPLSNVTSVLSSTGLEFAELPASGSGTLLTATDAPKEDVDTDSGVTYAEYPTVTCNFTAVVFPAGCGIALRANAESTIRNTSKLTSAILTSMSALGARITILRGQGDGEIVVILEYDVVNPIKAIGSSIIETTVNAKIFEMPSGSGVVLHSPAPRKITPTSEPTQDPALGGVHPGFDSAAIPSAAAFAFAALVAIWAVVAL